MKTRRVIVGTAFGILAIFLMIGYFHQKTGSPDELSIPSVSGKTSTSPALNEKDPTDTHPGEIPGQMADFSYYEGYFKVPYRLDYVTDTSPNFDDPISFYDQHLALAMKGNDMSMYHIAMMDMFCHGREKGKTSEQQRIDNLSALQQLYDQGNIDEKSLTASNNRVNMCFQIWARMPEESIDWWNRALEAGNPIVKLSEEISNIGIENGSKRKIAELLGEAIATEDPFPMTYAIQFAKREDIGDVILQESWRYLVCRYQYQCNESVVEENLREKYHRYQVDEILDQAQNLSGMINSGEITDYDFQTRL